MVEPSVDQINQIKDEWFWAVAVSVLLPPASLWLSDVAVLIIHLWGGEAKLIRVLISHVFL